MAPVIPTLSIPANHAEFNSSADSMKYVFGFADKQILYKLLPFDELLPATNMII